MTSRSEKIAVAILIVVVIVAMLYTALVAIQEAICLDSRPVVKVDAVPDGIMQKM